MWEVPWRASNNRRTTICSKISNNNKCKVLPRSWTTSTSRLTISKRRLHRIILWPLLLVPRLKWKSSQTIRPLPINSRTLTGIWSSLCSWWMKGRRMAVRLMSFLTFFAKTTRSCRACRRDSRRCSCTNSFKIALLPGEIWIKKRTTIRHQYWKVKHALVKWFD